MLIGGVVDDQVEDDPDAALLGSSGQLGEVTEAAQCRVDAVEVADVVAAVTAGTRIDRVQPQAGDAQSGKVIEATDQPRRSPRPSPLESWNDDTSRL